MFKLLFFYIPLKPFLFLYFCYIYVLSLNGLHRFNNLQFWQKCLETASISFHSETSKHAHAIWMKLLGLLSNLLSFPDSTSKIFFVLTLLLPSIHFWSRTIVKTSISGTEKWQFLLFLCSFSNLSRYIIYQNYLKRFLS